MKEDNKQQEPKRPWYIRVLNFIDHICNVIYKGFMKYLDSIWGLLTIAIIITALAVILRLAFLDRGNGDTYWFQIPWTNWYRERGLFGLGELPISYYYVHDEQVVYTNWAQYEADVNSGFMGETVRCDYAVGYLNLLAVFSYLPVNSLYVCKIIAICSDIVAAIGVGAIIYYITKEDKVYTTISYCVYLVLPTIFINSGIWGQCDGLYTCLVIWCIYFTIKKQPWFAMMFLGFALGTKLQAMFIIPVFAFLWLRKEFKLRWMLLIPVAMFALMIPSYACGMSFATPWMQYFNQLGTYKSANLWSGSMYVIFTGVGVSQYMDAFGIPLALCMIIITLVVLWKFKVKVTPISILAVSALFCILFPFFLPHMHERYFYMADVFVFIYCMARKKRYWLILIAQFASFNAYTHFLFGTYLFPVFGEYCLYFSMFANIAMMVILLYDILHLEKVEDTPQQVMTKQTS